MAAAVLQAQGTAVGNTTGDLTVGLPAHVADDILILVIALWAPNTASAVDAIPTPSGWTQAAQTSFPATADGRFAIFWRRATGSGTADPVIARAGLNWDTGTDTNLSGRAYTVRGAKPSGNFWEDVNFSALHTAADQNFPAIDVLGSQRLVLLLAMSNDDQGLGAPPSGWTAGTGENTTAGTDSAFQTFRKDDHGTDTTADASNANAPGQGRYWFFGWSIPPEEMTLALGDTVTLSDSASKQPGLAKADTVTLSDAVSKKPGLGKGDTVTLGDAVSKKPGLGKGDTVTLGDAVSKKPGVSLTDSLGMSDALGKGVGMSRGDTITLSDVISKAVGKAAADVITLSDVIDVDLFAGGIALTLDLADTITLSDSLAKSVGKNVGDTVTLTDVLVKGVGVVLADQIGMSDTVAKAIGVFRGDALTLSDSTAKAVGKAVADTLTLSDNLVSLLGQFAVNRLKGGGIARSDTLGGRLLRNALGGKPDERTHSGRPKEYNQGGRPKDTKHGGPVNHG